MAVELTDAAVKKARTGSAAQIDLWDSKVVGLGLRVAASGLKIWNLRYRVNGQQRRFKLGKYPRVTLAAARKRVNEELRKVDGGVNPQVERAAAAKAAEAAKLAEARAKRDSIEALCESYIERHPMQCRR